MAPPGTATIGRYYFTAERRSPIYNRVVTLLDSGSNPAPSLLSRTRNGQRSSRRLCILLMSNLLLAGTPVGAQTSQFALRFFGTGVEPPGQQDRLIFEVDDNQPGIDGSTPLDVGTGSFTFELWLRGRLQDNNTNNADGDVELFNYDWINGNIFLDRDIWCGSERKFGASLAGGLVRFGVAAGDAGPFGFVDTIEGSVQILDDQWHHVALVRDISTGQLHIYVDGQLDFSSSLGATQNDLSYPDDGVPVTGNCSTGQLTPYGWLLVLAAEKHDAGAAYPSFNGYMDEVRIWAVVRTPTEIAASWNRRVAPTAAGLVADYRFEEGMGDVVSDSSAAESPDGELRVGLPGNGEWVSWATDPDNTCPVLPAPDLVFADGFESGDTSGWSFSLP